MRLVRPRHLTRRQIALAFLLAGLADGLQFVLGPAGFLFFDEVVDFVIMVPLVLLLGFHPLLLPTLLVELIPVVDLVPTWTACVAMIVALRKRESPREEVISVEATVTPVDPADPAASPRSSASTGGKPPRPPMP